MCVTVLNSILFGVHVCTLMDIVQWSLPFVVISLNHQLYVLTDIEHPVELV